MRYWLEFAPVWLLVKVMGVLPRPLARGVGIGIGALVYRFYGRLRRVGERNLELAMPELNAGQRTEILRGVFTSLGRMLAEICLFPRYTPENIADVAVYDGLENFQVANGRGKGVLFLTAHLGGWEVGSYAHSVYGHPLKVVVRELDNPFLNRMTEQYRTRYGNSTFSKQEFARGLISAMRAGETVGLLVDTNMTLPQGVFVPFFGIQACTAVGLARVALHTDASVVPAFTIWDDKLGKYRVRFEPPLELVRTGNSEADAVANTALFNRAIEDQVRQHPDQWLWVHRRWKTRPAGEPPLY
jgi:Kdo2-lipid IVA lauroyltransferase/acyltransferase